MTNRARTLALAALAIMASGARARGDEPPHPLWVASVSATSTFADRLDRYAAWRTVLPKTTYLEKANEFRYDSAWCEGKRDEGVGESITIAFARPTTLATVNIKTGVWLTQKLFDANNLITGLLLITDDGRTIPAIPPARREELVVPLGGAAISSLTIKITAVKKARMNDSCLTEISFGENHAVAVGFPAAAVAAYPAAVNELVDKLWNGDCELAALTRYVEFPLRYVAIENTHASDESKRFIFTTTVFKSAAALHKACPMNRVAISSVATGTLSTSQPSRLSLTYDLAEYSQSMQLAWRNDRWRLVGID